MNKYTPLPQRLAFELGKLQALVACLKSACDHQCHETASKVSDQLEATSNSLWELLNGFDPSSEPEDVR